MLADVFKPPTQEIIDEKLSKLTSVKQIILSINHVSNQYITKLKNLNIKEGTSFLSMLIHDIRKRLNLNVHYDIDFCEKQFSYVIKIYTKFGYNSDKDIRPDEETLSIFITRKWDENNEK